MPKITDYTNQIQDGRTARSIYDLAYEILEGNFTRKIAGTSYSVTAGEMDQRMFSVKLENTTAPGSVYAVVPWTGDITTIYAMGDTLSSGPSVFSFGGNGIAMSGNIITTTTGQTMGASWGNVSPTAGAKSITAGQVMRISSNGGCTAPTALDVVFSVLMDIT